MTEGRVSLEAWRARYGVPVLPLYLREAMPDEVERAGVVPRPGTVAVILEKCSARIVFAVHAADLELLYADFEDDEFLERLWLALISCGFRVM